MLSRPETLYGVYILELNFVDKLIYELSHIRETQNLNSKNEIRKWLTNSSKKLLPFDIISLK